MNSVPFYQRTSFIYFTAIIASAILSLWVNIHESVINPDAICYLYSAEEFGKSGLQAAMHLCPQAMWPFYSSLIYVFVRLTHLSYTNAAFLLDGFLSTLSVVTFIAIVKELGGSRLVMWLAAIVILLSHQFNILRQDIIRDHGFWAFYLMSLFFLLRFFRDPKWMNAFAWSTSLLIATIFRIEGAIFIMALPFLSWCCARQPWRQRLKYFFMLNLFLLIIAMIVTGWLLIHPQQAAGRLGRIPEVGIQLQHGVAMILDKYQATKAAISQSVLTHNSLRDAGIVVFLLLISWYLVTVIGNVSLIYAFLVIYAWLTKAASFSRSGLMTMLGYLLVNLLVTFGFFAQNHFLAKRYLIALSLVLMLWVPFALEKLLSSHQTKQRLSFWLASIFIFISAIGGIFHFGHSKDYIRQAGEWLAVNVPTNAKLYSNDYQLMYYSQHFGKNIFLKLREYNDVNKIAQGRWKKYDYLALLMSKNSDDTTAIVMQEIHLVPMQVFVSDNGDHVYIYKISQQESKS